MIVRFVDIDGIGDHHCLNLIFIIIMNNVRLNNNVITLNSHFCIHPRFVVGFVLLNL